MEDCLDNTPINIVGQLVDQSICPDCEHPICSLRINSAVKRIEAYALSYHHQRLAAAMPERYTFEDVKWADDIVTRENQQDETKATMWCDGFNAALDQFESNLKGEE